MIDEDRPPPRTVALDGLSIEDLEAKIVALQAEIAACERVLAQKRAHLSAAAGLFGAPAKS